MSVPAVPAEVHYPESDGKPMADNTLQFQWIQVLAGNLAALFRDRADVFVGGDLFWYPVQGFNNIVQAPDTFVVFGRPQGYRGSYKQWEENDVPMTVVFEVRSPNDKDALMEQKLEFYDRYEVEEYYMLDPNAQPNRLQGYRRRGDALGPMRLRNNRLTSPRLGIHLDVSAPVAVVYYPDGERFLTFEELKAQQVRDRERANKAEAAASKATAVATEAQQLVASAQQRATSAELRAARLAELSRKARRGLASPEELTELDRLEEGTP